MKATATLTLTAADLHRLRSFRIPDELIELHEITRATSVEARGSYGIQYRGDLAGLILPIWGTDDTIKGYLDRRDNPEIKNGKPDAKYVRSIDRPHLFFEKTSRQYLSDLSVPVVFVEAYSSALAIAALCQRTGRRLLIIVTFGCWGWHGTTGKAANENGARVDVKGPSPDLDHIPSNGRKIIICLDSNVTSNRKVQDAESALQRDQAKRGAVVYLARIPQEPGVNGPDDFLARHTDEEFLQLLDNAVEQSDVERTLQELAKLSRIDYDRQRETIAKLLEIRVSTLDDEVEKRRPVSVKESDNAILLQEPDPWPLPVEGAELLDDIQATFERYVILPAGASIMLALWILHTYLLDSADASPIVAVSSPEKRCGKTVVLEILQALAFRALPASNITAAALFRTIEAFKPTLLIDEADTFLRDNDELRGVLNSGHRRTTAVIIRTTGDNFEPKTFKTWCPKAIAMIGKLPPTIEDRSIVILMRRKSKAERVERIIHRVLASETQDLCRKAVRWAQDNLEALKFSDPALPDSLNDRAADCWRPLLAIADRAAGNWPTLSREASLSLMSKDGDSSVSVQLLADIRDLFESLTTDRLSSETIVAELAKLESRPWPEWKAGKSLSKSQLARILSKFDIVVKAVRFPSGVERGYTLSQFDDAFPRYLPSESVTPLQPAPDVTCNAIEKRYSEEGVTLFKTLQPAPDMDCNDVTLLKPETDGKEEL